ncbi:MAG: hypothetical protein A2951_01250 [Candidatus Buchananbacteria bacterium RIFCSPLOWO2_01_FULL_56_15]|uniref:DUF4134 domain-containing protein n=2 Tax=Candidatus Buchananiibacteriota TaxID=1817903 RepID=A0A1G1YHV5_9BACT|nr:MAG: hypothetical protein A3J59_04825 [Candidatus Buchananbacteria bacterium RIFCSPHIGHO2_02_FULL_56_16]OGY54641.1 MAG: hypothetical protein A2951_01250 [Candidatus Buchananbacteria bacterium RIFCSPLOWO2_01_FULL_56_15]
MKKFTAVALTSVTMMSLLAVPVLALDTGINYGTALGLGTKDVREGTMSIVNSLLGFLGIIAILIILWGGFRWMTAGGNEEKIGEAKKIITAGIIGLVIIFISFALATFVINSLVKATGV